MPEILEKKTCDCGCGTQFLPPPDAPHKRFASSECRNRWHASLQAEARELVKQKRAAKAAAKAKK